MVISAEVLRNHICYTQWATRRLLKCASDLSADELMRDFGTADGSVIGTLNHIFRSVRGWLKRLKGERVGPIHGSPENLNLEGLTSQWPPLHDQWSDWSEALDDSLSDQLFTFVDAKGQQSTQPTWQVVFHVVNHATHHRGQVSGFLRALGKTPPPLDFIAFVREEKQEQSPAVPV